MSSDLSLIAFDYGKRRIGVAVGQTITCTARPLVTLNTPGNNSDSAWSELAELFKQWRPDRVVVGLPLTLDGAEQKMSKLARAFAVDIESRYGCITELADERLSTQAAKDSMRDLRQQGGKQKQVAGLRDSLSAKHILEQWLREYESKL